MAPGTQDPTHQSVTRKFVSVIVSDLTLSRIPRPRNMCRVYVIFSQGRDGALCAQFLRRRAPTGSDKRNEDIIEGSASNICSLGI